MVFGGIPYSLTWVWWTCLVCKRERVTIGWWAQDYACDHIDAADWRNRHLPLVRTKGS